MTMKEETSVGQHPPLTQEQLEDILTRRYHEPIKVKILAQYRRSQGYMILVSLYNNRHICVFLGNNDAVEVMELLFHGAITNNKALKQAQTIAEIIGASLVLENKLEENKVTRCSDFVELDELLRSGWLDESKIWAVTDEGIIRVFYGKNKMIFSSEEVHFVNAFFATYGIQIDDNIYG